MNILNAILGAQDGQAVGALSQQFGLSQDQTVSALGALLPALAGGLQRNVSSQGGLEQLTSALTGGQHGRYLDETSMLGSPDTTNDGNAILGHILGTRDVSRAVATNAASATGISPDILKRMLPVVAALAMGALAKQSQFQPGQAGRAQMTDSIGSLAGFLDVNRDGSVADDVLGFVGKMFKQRTALGSRLWALARSSSTGSKVLPRAKSKSQDQEPRAVR